MFEVKPQGDPLIPVTNSILNLLEAVTNLVLAMQGIDEPTGDTPLDDVAVILNNLAEEIRTNLRLAKDVPLIKGMVYDN